MAAMDGRCGDAVVNFSRFTPRPPCSDAPRALTFTISSHFSSLHHATFRQAPITAQQGLRFCPRSFYPNSCAHKASIAAPHRHRISAQYRQAPDNPSCFCSTENPHSLHLAQATKAACLQDAPTSRHHYSAHSGRYRPVRGQPQA